MVGLSVKMPRRTPMIVLTVLCGSIWCGAAAATDETGAPNGLKNVHDQPVPAAELQTPDATADLAYGAFQRGYYLSAFAIATKNAGAGDSAAQTLLGLIYEHGYGVPQDLEKSASWYELASNGGDKEAQYRLGLLYLDGLGVEKDSGKAAEYFRRAAGQKQAKAAYNLGLFYLEGKLFEKDMQKAVELFRVGAEANNGDAQYALALMHKRGQGLAADDAEAFRWFGRAAASGHLPAQVEMAIMVFNGVGTAKDEEAAAHLFKQAANSGNPVAMNRLARLYAAGLGLQADPIEAGKWHIRARQAGVSDLWLDGFLKSLEQGQQDEALARAYPKQDTQAAALIRKDDAAQESQTAPQTMTAASGIRRIRYCP